VGLRIALFGQAPFGRDCLDRLREEGHEAVGVFVPGGDGPPDPLAARAEELGLPVIRRRYFRRRDGSPIPAALDAYRDLGAELNVLAFVTSFLPRQIVDAPKHRSLCFHPSLLPRYRGGAAINWQIILGEREAGVSVFVPDEGVDTGPIVVQRGGVILEPGETTGSLYFRKLYPLGLDAITEAVGQVESGTARPQPQDESRATFQGLVDDRVACIDLKRSAEELDRLVRGCDPQPGAFVRVRGVQVRLYDARLEPSAGAPETVVSIESDGIVIGLRGGNLRVGRVRADRKKEPAHDFADRIGLHAGERVESGEPPLR
jgi:methionyl-tRNA formyltransferase